MWLTVIYIIFFNQEIIEVNGRVSNKKCFIVTKTHVGSSDCGGCQFMTILIGTMMANQKPVKITTWTFALPRSARLWTVAQSATWLQSPAGGSNFLSANSLELRSLGAPNLGQMDPNVNMLICWALGTYTAGVSSLRKPEAAQDFGFWSPLLLTNLLPKLV